MYVLLFPPCITQCGALRFTDGKISWVSVWVTVFSPNDIAGLRRPNNVIFGTKVASIMRMMHALRFLEKFLIVAKFANNCQK